MDFNISLGIGGWALAIIAAFVFGVAVQLIGHVEFGYEWIISSVAAFVGIVVASEFIIDLRAYEPVWDGLALLPAIAGGLLVGLVVAVVTRYATGGSFLAEPQTA